MEKKLFLKKGISSVRAKLVSAVAMLLVATTMVVSSTYAWFTLSTAPEVSGITTAIGANGALEIRLNSVTDGRSNNTAGNIVDLAMDPNGDDPYGLSNVILLPSQLVTATDASGAAIIDPQFVQFPTYGANGKPGELVKNATAGVFNGNNFVTSSATGVRAIGVSSGLTDRQYAYRNAKYAASNYASQATTKAATSLNTNGGVLGGIVIKKATADNPSFTKAEIEALGTIVNDLKIAAGYIETAYEEMIVALAASALVSGDGSDAVYTTIRNNFNDDTLTLAQIAADKAITVGEYSVSLEGKAILTAITKLQTTIANITAAETAYNSAYSEDKESYEWNEISGILNYLIVIENAKLNGNKVSGTDAMSKEDLAASVMEKGINITLEDGAGVYVEIADHCGDYSANVTMTNVSVSGMTFPSLTANMATKSSQNISYLDGSLAVVTAAGSPAGGGGADSPMTEFYGFIVDLGFKTNAASSNLLLQTTPADRIYADNNNELTQGKGSYMTYKATTTELTTDQVKGLMDCIRIVFFETGTQKVLGEARLDTANATIGADGVTAMMYMYKDGVLQNGGEEAENTDTSIVALPQNNEVQVSVLVYLDGAQITNADVAATATSSVTGSMNIQFASDAELKPMEYGDLHTPNKSGSTEGNT